MDQAAIMTRNEKSWEGALFYEPKNLFATVQEWLFNSNPSARINATSCKSVVLLHPFLDVSQYKKARHRDGFAVPDHVKAAISSKTMTEHAQLLTAAVDCKMYQGFWFLSCKREHYWDHYFEKIATAMYHNASKHEKGYQFVKIEARWHSSPEMGIIMISHPSFTNEDLITASGEIIENLINYKDVGNGHVSRWLSFKPQFYLDSGFDVNFLHNFNANIYSKDLCLNQGSPFRYSDGVKIWLNKHLEQMQRAKPQLLSNCEICSK